MENINDLAKSASNAITRSVTFKLIVVGILILLMLIPISLINNLLKERKQRARDAIKEISEKWAGSQTIQGPILAVPYLSTFINKDKEVKSIKKYAYVFPETNIITGHLHSKILSRGIFDAVVYNSDLEISGQFDLQTVLKKLETDKVLLNECELWYSVSDLKGISAIPVILWDGKKHHSESFYSIENNLKGFKTTLVPLSDKKLTFDYRITLQLKGSQEIAITPLAKVTQAEIDGDWHSPSFYGTFLPTDRAVGKEDFNAKWQVLEFNRPFSPVYYGAFPKVDGYDFGVNLYVPVDQYQKSERTNKYALLIILLTFVALFLTEIILKIRIHPIQYLLIGCALAIYYSLLLSISEHWGYSVAYLIASLATVSLIALYSKALFNGWKYTAILATSLLSFYSFIWIIVDNEEFALLIGTIGLFVVLAAIMYLSRAIKWYSFE